jgi:hypothetical protein
MILTTNLPVHGAMSALPLPLLGLHCFGGKALGSVEINDIPGHLKAVIWKPGGI